MDLHTLILALQRIANDPRVGASTPVHVEMTAETNYYYGDLCNSEGRCHPSETVDDTRPLASISIDSDGGRSIVLSALNRRDALAR